MNNNHYSYAQNCKYNDVMYYLIVKSYTLSTLDVLMGLSHRAASIVDKL